MGEISSPAKAVEQSTCFTVCNLVIYEPYLAGPVPASRYSQLPGGDWGQAGPLANDIQDTYDII